MIKFHFLAIISFICIDAIGQTIVADNKSTFSNQISELGDVASLKLEGNIEFVDFSALRNMDSLRVLDMSALQGETIEQSALSGCKKLETVTFPSSIKSLDGYVLTNCKNLKQVNIGDSLTNIGCNVFQNCIKLTSISFPPSLKSIGNFAFTGCLALRSLVITSDTPPSIGSLSFDTNHKLILSVKPKALAVYREARGWSIFFNKRGSIKAISK